MTRQRIHQNNKLSRLADLTNHKPKTCAYIAGEDHYACGEPTLAGKPYCAPHWAVTHRKEKAA